VVESPKLVLHLFQLVQRCEAKWSQGGLKCSTVTTDETKLYQRNGTVETDIMENADHRRWCNPAAPNVWH